MCWTGATNKSVSCNFLHLASLLHHWNEERIDQSRLGRGGEVHGRREGYLLELAEFRVGPESFEVIQCVYVVEGVAVICLREEVRVLVLLEQLSEHFRRRQLSVRTDFGEQDPYEWFAEVMRDLFTRKCENCTCPEWLRNYLIDLRSTAHLNCRTGAGAPQTWRNPRPVYASAAPGKRFSGPSGGRRGRRIHSGTGPRRLLSACTRPGSQWTPARPAGSSRWVSAPARKKTRRWGRRRISRRDDLLCTLTKGLGLIGSGFSFILHDGRRDRSKQRSLCARTNFLCSFFTVFSCFSGFSVFFGLVGSDSGERSLFVGDFDMSVPDIVSISTAVSNVNNSVVFDATGSTGRERSVPGECRRRSSSIRSRDSPLDSVGLVDSFVPSSLRLLWSASSFPPSFFRLFSSTFV